MAQYKINRSYNYCSSPYLALLLQALLSSSSLLLASSSWVQVSGRSSRGIEGSWMNGWAGKGTTPQRSGFKSTRPGTFLLGQQLSQRGIYIKFRQGNKKHLSWCTLCIKTVAKTMGSHNLHSEIVVVPSVKRRDYISPTLRQLHWLPIKLRIEYKIASLVFITLYSKQPSYLADLLIPCAPSRTLRSSYQHLLHVPFVKSFRGKRAFSFTAPFIWNSLLLSLRTCSSITSFHAHLKMHLFPPWISFGLYGLIPW